MIIYIAGKMSGLKDFGRDLFNTAEQYLTDKGHIVLNPAKLPIGLNNESYMPIGFEMIRASDAIYMLNNYNDSIGARLELDFALYQNKKVLF